MIVLIGGQKGGTGKSTVATNLCAVLAQDGKDVLLVDGNAAQGTASNWAARRDDDESLPAVPCVEKSGNLYKALRDLGERYDTVIVDTGGQDSKEFRTAMLAADVLVTPIRPSQADIETLVVVNDLVDQAQEMNNGLKPVILITNAPTHPAVKLVEETRELLGELGNFYLANTVIFNRKAYIDAMPVGAGVAEMGYGAAKATHEIRLLQKELFE